MYALARDAGGSRGAGRASRSGAPATAAFVITGFSVAIYAIYLAAFHANAEDSFAWSGTIGTLILLVAYALSTIGCRRKCSSAGDCRCRCGRPWSR